MKSTPTTLLDLAKANLNWDIRRQRFLVAFILALIAVRTVNLTEIACHMGGTKRKAAYRKIQRFFQVFKPSSVIFLKFLLSLLPDEPLVLVMDRTNWDYGVVHINFLVLGVLYQSTVIPLCWLVLEKKGNSNQTERIQLLNFLLRVLPISSIKVLIADREFIGKDWLNYLKTRGVKRCIRMKKSGLIFPDYKARNLWLLFAGLKIGETRFLRRQYRIGGEWFHLAAVMLESDLLVVACDDKPRSGLQYYGLRWGIETLFGNTKTRGFHFEDTHLVDPKKLGMLMGLVSLGALWALRVGEWLEKTSSVMRRKSHGRFERSLFRVGLDYLRGIIFDGELERREHRFVFQVLTCT
jgi:Transposase DDE domain